MKGLPLELGIGARVKKTRMMVLPGRERSLTTSSARWIRYTNVTDGQTDVVRQHRPRLHIASRGNNTLFLHQTIFTKRRVWEENLINGKEIAGCAFTPAPNVNYASELLKGA